jgi:rhodanese-related sulfurtransferase
MNKTRIVMILLSLLVLSSTSVSAQFLVIDSEQLRSLVTGNEKAVLVDSRTPEEYEQAHIPGALNIMPEQMKIKAATLPKNKTTRIIFYCRGMG